MSPVCRPLTPGEIALARCIFTDSIDYARVRVHARNYVFWQGTNYIVTPNGHLYLGRKLRHYTDFSIASTPIRAFFIHEMTHVWQHQRGINVLWRGLGEQVLHFLGFNQYRYRLDPGKPLAAYKLEQQGDIMRDWYMAKSGLAAPYADVEYLALVGELPGASGGRSKGITVAENVDLTSNVADHERSDIDSVHKNGST